MKYSVDQIVQIAFNTLKYRPELASALNNVLTATSEVEYNAAIEETTTLVHGYDLFGRGVKTDLGLPVFMPVELQAKDGASLLLTSSILEFSRTKNVVITEVQGNDQSVIEFINNGTPRLQISGILSQRGFGYPIDLVEDFNTMMLRKEPLKITHEKANTLGVYEVVITDFDLPSSQFVNFQPYTIQCVKDEPINLRIT